MATTFASQLQRRDTAANWASANPVLGSGELGLETDTGAYKIGDGATVWNSLSYHLAPRRDYVKTVTVASSATATDTIILDPSSVICAIETDKAAWVRVYNSAAASSADSSRARNTDPISGSGVLVEVITNGAEVVNLTPLVTVANMESPVTAVYPIRVTNDAESDDVSVIVTYIKVFS